MNLHQALAELAISLQLEPQFLIDYANEDTVGGYHPDPASQLWPMGSIFAVEGQFLYALIRALRPQKVIEVGVYSGCSTTHILRALIANRKGTLISYDHEYPGWLVPPDLKARWKFVQADAFEALAEEKFKAEIVFEDAFHDNRTGDLVKLLVAQCDPHVIISHDAMHSSVGEWVRKGWQAVFDEFNVVLIEPSDCGLAWKVIHG